MALPHLASYTQANSHLDGTKIKFADANDAEPEATNADAYVRGRLVGVFPDHVDLWASSPGSGQEQAPDIIMLAASLLMAAERYRKMYALEDTSSSSFAGELEAKADSILMQLNDGEITIPGITGDDTEHMRETDFWPNDTTRVTADNPQVGLEVGDPLRFATMDRTF